MNQTVQKKLGNWMETNKSKKWSIGCKFVAWLYNTSYHNAVKNLPFVLVFGQQPKVGISNLPIDPNVLNTLATEADLNDIIQVENAPDDVASDERQSAGLDCVDGGGQLSGSQGGSHGGDNDDNDDNDDSVACSSLTAEEDNGDNDGFLTVHFHDVKVHFHAAMSQRTMEVPNSLPLCLIFDRYRQEEIISPNTKLTFFLKNSGLVADDHCNGVYIDSDSQLCLLNLDIRGEIVFLVHGPQISQPNHLEESGRIVGGPLKSQHTVASGVSTAEAALAKKRTWTEADDLQVDEAGLSSQGRVRKKRTLLTPSAGVSSRGRQRRMSQVMAESLSQAAKSNHGDDVNKDDYEPERLPRDDVSDDHDSDGGNEGKDDIKLYSIERLVL